MNKEQLKQCYLLVAFGILLFAALMNFSEVLQALGNIGSMLVPIIAGLLLAFILNVPMNGIDKRLQRLSAKTGRRLSDKQSDTISLVGTLIAIVLALSLVLRILIPELIQSARTIPVLIRRQWPVFRAYLEQWNIDTQRITTWLNSSEFDALVQKVTANAGAYAGQVMDFAGNAVSGVATAGIAIVIALYILMSKATLGRHCRKLIDVYVKKSIADKIYYVCHLIHDTYAKFLSGQCVEACILGSLIFIAFSIFGLPYAGLTAVLTTVMAFIPYIGAFCACGIGAALTLLVEPSRAIVSIIVYLVVQFIENNFIYPHVVGNSVGLSPLWTLIAVLIGGKLFGIMGMILFIPLMSVIYTLVKNDANKRIVRKKGDMSLD